MFRIERTKIFALIATFYVALLLVAHAKANPLDITSSLSSSTTMMSETSMDSSADTTTKAPSNCQYMNACGWGVYGENKKKIKYFIRNTCKCSPEYGCLLDDDDLSLSAFVYRCKERKVVST